MGVIWITPFPMMASLDRVVGEDDCLRSPRNPALGWLQCTDFARAAHPTKGL